MRLKIHTVIGMFAWPLAILAASLPIDSVASVLSVATTDWGVNHPPSVRAVSYGMPVYSASIRPAVKDARIPGGSSVSVAPEVDGGALLAAIMGLIGMRLWRSGKKKLPVIK